MFHEASCTALAFSRDSELLASGGERGQVRIWRVETGESALFSLFPSYKYRFLHINLIKTIDPGIVTVIVTRSLLQ